MRRLRLCSFFVCSILVSCLLQSTMTCAQANHERAGMLRSDTFGAGWAADSLANFEIGRFVGRMASYRFRANHTGTFSAVEVYFVFQTLCDGCYADGNGGIIQVEIQSDDGTDAHMPSGVALATAVITDPMKQWNRLVTFSTAPYIQADSLYHIVFTNLSPDPVHNYVSIDTLYYATGGLDSQPAAKTLDLAVITKADTAHPPAVTPTRIPIFSIYFDDGYRQGQFYMDVRRNTVVGAPGSPVSEYFAVKDIKHLATTLSVRLAPVAAQGTIMVTIVNNVGSILATGTIDLSNAVPNVYNWYGISFPQISLFKGAYTIILTAANGAQFYVSPIQQGAWYGFQWETNYTSQCQVMSNNKWSGCLGRTDLDIPFYFR